MTSAKTTSSAQPLITVAVCTRNRAKLLERTIRTVLPQLADETELLIVDNNSTDGTDKLIQQLMASEPRIKIYKETKIGGTVARNSAITKASGKYVLFLDDDAAVEPGWLNAYRQFLTAPPSERIAAVGGAHYPEYEISPPQWIGAERNKIDLWPLPTRFPYGGSAGECNCAFLRSAVVQAGLFDERLGHTGGRSGTGEGPDLHLRLQDAGWEIWWLPGAAVRDFFPASRLNFRCTLNAAFNDGRSTAIRRVKYYRNWMSRAAYGVGRIAITPVHAFANILMGLFILPVSRVKAAEHFLRVYHSCGLAWQLLSAWSETMFIPPNQNIKTSGASHPTNFRFWQRLGESLLFQLRQFLRRTPDSPITFCIAHFNSPDFLAINLRAVRRFYPKARIIVADALSAWDEYVAAKKICIQPDAEIHPLIGRYRHTGLLNYMFRKVRSPIAIFLDQDCILLDRLDGLFKLVESGKVLIGPADEMFLAHPNFRSVFPSVNRQLRSASQFVHASFLIADVFRIRSWAKKPFHWQNNWGPHPLERYYGISQLVHLKQPGAIQFLTSRHTGYGLGMIYAHAGRPLAYHNWYSGRVYGQLGKIDGFDIDWLQRETNRFFRDYYEGKLDWEK